MSSTEKKPAGPAARGVAAIVAMATSLSIGTFGTVPGSSAAQEKPATLAGERQSRFYCNTKALSPSERARHKLLTDKLLALRTATVETEKGYEFQYSPSNMTVGEVAEWVVMESKCCPFFDFHIDLEEEGKLICLRLTGEEGIKQFIRAEFNLH
jgi:hypothetical protein